MKIEKVALTLKPNYKYIPVTITHNYEEWNEIYISLLNNKEYHYIERTTAGSIPIGVGRLKLPCWDLRITKSVAELTVLESNGMYRLQFRSVVGDTEDDNSKKIYGSQAFKKFKDKCKEMNVDLEKFRISYEEGLKVKSTIEKPFICYRRNISNLTFINVHHVDFHSSYPAGASNAFPELRPVFEYFYKGRKKAKINKAVMNFTIGFMQSYMVKYGFSHISKAAISDNNTRVLTLASEMEDAGRTILLFNTDGFWYMGDIYHGEGEGEEMGQWSNDHTNCTFRAKSPGVYEYMENDVYTPVVRGKTKLDAIKTRDKWEWGDIYAFDGLVVKYEFIEGYGFIPIEEENNG